MLILLLHQLHAAVFIHQLGCVPGPEVSKACITYSHQKIATKTAFPPNVQNCSDCGGFGQKSKLENFSSAVELAAFSFSSSSFGSSSKAAVTAVTICSQMHALSLFMFFLLSSHKDSNWFFPTDVSGVPAGFKIDQPSQCFRPPAASLVPRSFRSPVSAKPDMSSLAQLSMPQVLQPKDHPGHRHPPRYCKKL